MGNDTIDNVARVRLDHLANDHAETRKHVDALRADLVALDNRSAERHGASQAQNTAIIASNARIEERLNAPGAIVSLLGNKAAISGIVVLLGSLLPLLVALGYASGADNVTHAVESAACCDVPPAAPPVAP